MVAASTTGAASTSAPTAAGGRAASAGTQPSSRSSAPEGCHDATGGVAGGQIGYRWQSAAWVFGLEAQGDWADLRGSNVSLLIPAFTNRSQIDAFGLFTGQIGYAWNNALLYVKGGAAVTDNRQCRHHAQRRSRRRCRRSQTRWGGTVGAGIEFGFAPNWSAAVEYDHMFMRTKDTTFTDVTFGGLLRHATASARTSISSPCA